MSERSTTVTRTDIRGIIAFLALIMLIPSAGMAGGEEDKREKIKPEELSARLDLPARKVFYGGLMIAAGDTVTGPVIVIKGSLDIQSGGVLAGDAWVINGNLIMTGAAAIDGGALLVNGSEFLSHNAALSGGIERFRCECALDDAKYEESGEVVFIRKEDPRAVRTKLAVRPGRPTRVDYEILRLGFVRRNDRHRGPYTRAHGFLHVPIWKDTGGFLGFDAAVSVPISGEDLSFELAAFKRTESNDTWQIGRLENGNVTLLTGDDFLDHWERRGGEAGLRWRLSEYWALSGFVSYQQDVSLEAMRIHSMLRSTRRYRLNPAIDEGERLALSFRFDYDSREDESWRRSSWRLGLWFERGFKAGSADFDYEAFEVELSRYQYMGRRSRIDLRGRMFSSLSPLPGQLKRFLGGYAGVRGARDIPFPVEKGDRMALFSVEVRTRLPDIWGARWLFTSWDLLLFSDIGLLAEAEEKESPFRFLDRPFGEWRKTAGIGFSGQSFLPYVGFYIAQDLDRDRFEPRAILRFRKSF